MNYLSAMETFPGSEDDETQPVTIRLSHETPRLLSRGEEAVRPRPRPKGYENLGRDSGRSKTSPSSPLRGNSPGPPPRAKTSSRKRPRLRNADRLTSRPDSTG